MKNKHLDLSTALKIRWGGGRFLANNKLLYTAKNLYKIYINIVINTQNNYKLNTQLIT